MTDPTERTPSKANPFHSPDNAEGASRIDVASPSGIRPRWWEVLVLVLLLLVYLVYSPYSLASVVQDFRFGDLVGGLVTYTNLLEAIVLVFSIFGGMIALRLWWWQILPGGLAPGHIMMLTAIFAWGSYVVLEVVIGLTAEFLELTGEDLRTIDSLLIDVVTPVLHLVLLLLMLPRFGRWFWAAALTLAATAIVSLKRMPPTLNFNWGDGGLLFIQLAYLVAAISAVIVLVVIAVRQRKQSTHRDWLHWTGFACWLGMLVFPLVRVLVLRHPL